MTTFLKDSTDLKKAFKSGKNFLQMDLDAREQQVRILVEELSAAAENVDVLQRQREQLKRKVGIETVEGDTFLQMDLDTREQQVRILVQKLSAAEEYVDVLQRQREEYKRKAEIATAEDKAKQKQIEELQRIAEEKEKALLARKKEIVDQKICFETKNAEDKKAKQKQMQRLHSIAEEKEKALLAMKKEVDEQKICLEIKNVEDEAKQKQIKKLQRIAEEKEKALLAMKKEIGEQKICLEAKNAEVDFLTNTISNLHKKLHDMETDIRTKENVIKWLNKQLNVNSTIPQYTVPSNLVPSPANIAFPSNLVPSSSNIAQAEDKDRMLTQRLRETERIMLEAFVSEEKRYEQNMERRFTTLERNLCHSREKIKQPTEILNDDGDLDYFGDNYILEPTAPPTTPFSSIPVTRSKRNLPEFALPSVQTHFPKARSATDDVYRMSQDLKNLLLSEKESDVTIQVGDQQFKAHRIILMARSSVFAAMFQHDSKEKAEGVVNVEDCDPSSFPVLLEFLYCASSEKLSAENVFNLYRSADKFDVQDLKRKCFQFIKSNLSVDTFCKTVGLCLQYSEANLLELFVDFFAKNFKKILSNPKWKAFNLENPDQVNEIFSRAFP